jgi:uncharacterized protein (DUF4213/DUF364 family)
MLKKGTILSNLYTLILPQAETIKVADLRMAMQASRSKIVTRGLPQFYLISLPHGCMILPSAGNFAGSLAKNTLQYLIAGKNPLEITIGLAAANFLIRPPADAVDNLEATTCLDLQKDVKVATVGRILQIISEGRGTPALRPYRRFVNILLNEQSEN